MTGSAFRSGGTTRRVVIDGNGRLRIEEAGLPEPAHEEVVLRSLAIGICGSDLHVLEGRHPFVSYPVYPGHEVVARVERLGAGVDPAWLDARVVLEPSLYCGSCPACAAGRYNICESLQVMGFQAPGGMADRFIAPVDRLHLLPDTLGDEAAALVEPTAVAAHAVRLAGLEAGARVAVVGGGTIGLLTAQVAQACGAETTLHDTDGERLALASALGLRTGEIPDERRFDLSIECVGSGPALRAAIAAVRKGGRVLLVGVYGSEPNFQAALVQDFELTIQGVLMYTAQDYRRALELLQEGAVDANSMVSERQPLAEAEGAFALAKRGGRVLKVLLRP